jgi:hypothetical protein
MRSDVIAPVGIDVGKIAAQERLAAAHHDEEQIAHRSERLLQLLE